MRKHLQLKAWILLCVFTAEIFLPTNIMALGSGPSQPEMAAFTPAGTTEMVDPFTGDFTYNIPLMDVEGYPINIAYNSGVTMEQEASWVGLGWNLNVGTVNRSVRGLPDDFKGDEVKNTTSMKDMEIIKFGGGVGVEVFGDENSKKLLKKMLGKNKSKGLSFIYNNYKGFGIELNGSLGPSLNLGPIFKENFSLSGNLGITLNTLDGASVNSSLSASYRGYKESNHIGSIGRTRSSGYNLRSGQKYLSFGTTAGYHIQGVGMSIESSTTYLPIGIETYTPYPSITTTTETNAYSGSTGIQKNGVSKNYTLHGSKTTQSIKDPIINKNAFGYLYIEEAGNDDLMDFNRDKPTIYNSTIQNIPPSSLTYDVYTVSGQGVSGMFRPFRNDIGSVHDPYIGEEKSNSDELGVEFALGGYFKGGANNNSTEVYGSYGKWFGGAHSAFEFTGNETNSIYEKVYFKAAGDLAETDIDYFNNELFGTEAVAFGLNRMSTHPYLIDEEGYSMTKVFPTEPIVKRKARSKQLSFLTAREASDFYETAFLKSYDGTFSGITTEEQAHTTTDIARIDNNRKEHHIAEIVQINPDGERFVYGLAAYNNSKADVTFSVKKENEFNYGSEKWGRVLPDDNENSMSNKSGLDELFTKKEVPAYAHSYLLTEKQSVDYRDITGDGPSMDDGGNAWQFNYTRTSQNFGWRIPYTNFTFNKGFESTDRDQKGSCSFGTKEMWYTHSVESKNLVAEFKIKQREDAVSANIAEAIQAPYGGLGTDVSYKLDRIVLYNKYDRIKNGDAAIPIKTIAFEYDYSLCEGVENQLDLGSEDKGIGKLTLRKIEMWYGNNTTEKESPYEFHYSGDAGVAGINPDYHPMYVDRWGNYKNPLANGEDPWNPPNPVSNAEFPYVTQESNDPSFLPNEWASAWNLREITTPSGGKITVDYESDDYAYIQDKRAMEMMQVVGTSQRNNSNKMFQSATKDFLYDESNGNDFNRIYIKRPSSIPLGLNEVQLKELLFDHEAELSNMYFRFKTNLPNSKWDYVSGYVTANAIGYADDGDPNTNDDEAYLYIDVVGNRNPFSTTSWGFFRQNLFGVLYEQPSVKDGVGVEPLVKGMKAIMRDIQQYFTGVEAYLESKGIASKFKPEISFVRLYNPAYKKLGGGSRVSRIEMNDNWSQMSTDGQDATYGQEYDYTTTDEHGNTISSGVATYEPFLGNDENPFREPVSYIAQGNKGHIPAINDFQETPFGESFFPSASVGYSKVKVTSIHRNTGNTSNLITEHNFYTAKDFPVIVAETDLSGPQRYDNPAKDKKQAFPYTNKKYRSELAMSQGYSIVLNDMHGKPSITEAYTWQDVNGTIVKKIVAGTKVNYHHKVTEKGMELDNAVEVLSDDGTVTTKLLGVEYDVTIDSQRSYDETETRTDKWNMDIIPSGGAIPWVIILPYFHAISDIKEAKSLVVTKIIQMYGLVESVENYTDQYRTTQYNQLYDGTTGQVLLSKVEDEHKTEEYSLNVPAYLTADLQRMGPAYKSALYEAELEIEDQGVNCYEEDVNLNNLGKSFKNRNGVFKHGDEVLIYPQDGSTPVRAWVDIDFETFNNNGPNGKDPIVSTNSEDCKNGWLIQLNNDDIPAPSKPFCYQNQVNDPDIGDVVLSGTTTSNLVMGEIEIYLPNQDIVDYYLDPKEASNPWSIPPTQSEINDAFCEIFANPLDPTNIFNTPGYDMQDAFYSTNNHELESIFDLDNEIKADLVSNNSERTIQIEVTENAIKNAPNFKPLLFNDNTLGPFDSKPIFLLKLKYQTSPTVEDVIYAIYNYDFGGYIGVSLNGSFINNPTVINTLAYNPNVASTPPCPLTFRLINRLGGYLSGFENGDKIKIIRSANRNMLMAHEGLVTSNDNPADIVAGKFKGIKDPSSINILQMQSQEYSDEYEVSDAHYGAGNSKFLNKSDGDFKVVRSHRYNGKRYQNSLGIETPKDGYLEGPPVSWTAYEDDCYFLMKSPLQTNDASWLLQEEIMSYYQNGLPMESKNAVNLHSTVLINSVGNVEAIAANAKKQNVMVESFENYKHIHQTRTWNNPHPWLTNNGFIPGGSLNYTENELTDVDEEVLVKGIGHTGEYAVFLRGNPNYITSFQYDENPLSSLASKTLGDDPITNSPTVNSSAFPNTNVLETDLLNSVPFGSDVYHEIDDATSGTFGSGGNGLNELTYAYDPTNNQNEWQPESGEYYYEVWVKEILPSNTPYKQTIPGIQISGVSGQTAYEPSEEIDGWYKISGKFTYQGSQILSVKLFGGQWGAFFDDLRIHPINSSVKSFVYDLENGRLKAQLDENNYATFYDYDDEGILSQMRRETSKGILTVTESRQSRKNQ